MEADRLMQAVLQSFIDADLRVEVVPRPEDKPTIANTGTGPSRERYDATTQVADGRYTIYKHPRGETIRVNSAAETVREHVNRTAQACDGRYATVYKVHHCKMVPTSPPVAASEFPPQRPDVAYGADNFQIGGLGSGETGSAPVKTTSYRGGGLNWTSRSAVYAPRVSRCTDPFVSSLRKYPSMSPDRSAEVLERLVTTAYSMPKTSRSPRYSPHRSPLREGVSYRCPRTYEETYAASCRPRAPEDSPTKDRRDDLRKLASAKHGDVRLIREVSRRLRKSIKSISTYPPTQTQPSLDGYEDRYDTPIPETSETDHEDSRDHRTPTYSVNSTVQAVATTISLGVETKPLPCQRTIAVPLSPSPSSKLSVRARDPKNSPVTRSIQTFGVIGSPIEAITSTTELTTHDPPKVIVKKSRSLNDFRSHRDFKEEILAWLDDTSDPKIKEIQEVVLKNLHYRLKGLSRKGAEKMKVKVANCLKFRHAAEKKRSSISVLNKTREMNTHTQSQEELSAEVELITNQNDFEDVIKDWLSEISIKKRDILLRPVKKDQIYNSLVNRLKHLVCEKSKYSREQEQVLRNEILEILEGVPIEVDTCDKPVYLGTLTDALCCRLQNIANTQNPARSKPYKNDIPDKSSIYFPRQNCQHATTRKQTKDFLINTMVVEVLKRQNAINPDVIKQTIVDLVDILMDSVNSKLGLDKIASAVRNVTKLTKEEAFEFAAHLTENCKDLNKEQYAKTARSQPLAVFMVQNLSRNYATKTSGTNMSRHSIGSIIDKDIEANLYQYKMQLAQKIDQWLSNLEILRANDTDFRQGVVLDLASDIVDRQKYLEFNKTRGTDMDELEHLRYQIFKWMKRYVDEDNIEMVDHAAELMEMIKNIPVPIMNTSQIHLYKSHSGISCKDGRFQPGTSNDISHNNVHGSKSDSDICNRDEFQSAVEKERKQKSQLPARCNRWDILANISNTSVHINSELSKSTLKDQKNCNEISKCKHSIKTTNGNSSLRTSKNLFKDPSYIGHKHDTPASNKYREELYRSHSDASCMDGNPGTCVPINHDDVVDSQLCQREESQNYSILTNYVVHKVSTNKTNNSKKHNSPTPSSPGRRSTTIYIDPDLLGRNLKKKKNSSENPQHKLNSSSNSDSKLQARAFREPQDTENINLPGPSGLVTPLPTYSDRPSSAVAKLIAEWQPPHVFTPPPPDRPLLSQLHEDFQEYLKNWCQQIPIPANTPDEMKIAEKARLGILNGIWKIITKIKAQPAVFQNRFYYEDVLGKEIDELLNCLPQTQELQDKRYSLKAQLLEKNSDMNELVKELEMPDNYKEIVSEKEKLLKDEKLRRFVKDNEESPTKIFEELLKYCTLDDFLETSKYKETDKILDRAYKNKLLRTIQAYMNEVKKSHGKEMEKLLNIWKESGIFDVLYKVPLPTDETVNENADEILLGLEIEQWMADLPLVQNDDGNEQRQRRRLRDALTKKIHEMGKRSSFGEGNPEVKHEISVFLDKVPLEKDQDLKINDMVEELTDRLKNRNGANGRKKAVVFQDGHQNQVSNQSRLLNGSQLASASRPDRRYPTGNEWALQEDQDVQYDMFRNAPLCSTRIEQQGDWDNEEDPDAQYGYLFKETPACSSMIAPQTDYDPRNNALVPPEYHHQIDQDSYFAYNPGQFHESDRGGSAGCSPHRSPSHLDDRYRYPDLVEPPIMPREGPPLPRFFDSQGNIITNVPLPENQYQPVRGPHNFTSAAVADQAPLLMRQVAFDPNRIGHNDASGFVSMADHGQPRPSGPDNHRSIVEPNVPQGAVAGFSSPVRGQALIEQGPFIADASRYTRLPNGLRSGRVAPLEASIHEDQRFSRGSQRAAVSHHQSQGSDMLQAAPTHNEFISLASHQQPSAIPPLETSVRRQSFRQANQPSIRVKPTSRPEFRRSTDREGIQEIINQNRSANRSVREQSQLQSERPSRDPQGQQVSPQNLAPPDRLASEPAGGAPSSLRRSDRHFLASNAPSSEISNQPAFYSTPEQRANLPPPNMRERRQIERERGPVRRLDIETEDADMRERRQIERERGTARRLDIETDAEGEERCHCRERWKRWKDSRQPPNCNTCEECMHGQYGHRDLYPYTYPYPYPYPYGRPPPPHLHYCRR